MKATGLAMLSKRLQGAIREDAAASNRRQPRNAFIKMTMKAEGKPVHVPLPRAAECMRLKITCAACSCRYAVIGAAFFCPSCGHSAVDQAFSGTLDAVRASIAALPGIRAAMPDRDAAENTSRLLLEGGLQNAVTAFQRFAEVTFEARGTGIIPRRGLTGGIRRDHRMAEDIRARPLVIPEKHFQAGRAKVKDGRFEPDVETLA